MKLYFRVVDVLFQREERRSQGDAPSPCRSCHRREGSGSPSVLFRSLLGLRRVGRRLFAAPVSVGRSMTGERSVTGLSVLAGDSTVIGPDSTGGTRPLGSGEVSSSSPVLLSDLSGWDLSGLRRRSSTVYPGTARDLSGTRPESPKALRSASAHGVPPSPSVGYELRPPSGSMNLHKKP